MTTVLIVCSCFNPEITDSLLDYAKTFFNSKNIETEIVRVPGALEIPQAVAFAAISPKKDYDGYLALGCVMKGQTDHYHYVASEVYRNLSNLATQHMIALGSGIIVSNSFLQAKERSNPDSTNNVALHACDAVLSMIDLRDKFL